MTKHNKYRLLTVLSCFGLFAIFGIVSLRPKDEKRVLNEYYKFLNGEVCVSSDGINVFLSPTRDSRYAIYDINGDGVPELLTSSIISKYVPEDSCDIPWTIMSSSIFSYNNGSIYTWYEGIGKPFEILSDNRILYIYQSNDMTGTSCFVMSFDNTGNAVCEKSLERQQNANGNIEYWIDGENVLEADWNLLFAAFKEKIRSDCWRQA